MRHCYSTIKTKGSSDPHCLIVLLQVLVGVHLVLLFDRDVGSFISEQYKQKTNQSVLHAEA